MQPPSEVFAINRDHSTFAFVSFRLPVLKFRCTGRRSLGGGQRTFRLREARHRSRPSRDIGRPVPFTPADKTRPVAGPLGMVATVRFGERRARRPKRHLNSALRCPFLVSRQNLFRRRSVGLAELPACCTSDANCEESWHDEPGSRHPNLLLQKRNQSEHQPYCSSEGMVGTHHARYLPDALFRNCREHGEMGSAPSNQCQLSVAWRSERGDFGTAGLLADSKITAAHSASLRSRADLRADSQTALSAQPRKLVHLLQG